MIGFSMYIGMNDQENLTPHIVYLVPPKKGYHLRDGKASHLIIVCAKLITPHLLVKFKKCHY